MYLISYPNEPTIRECNFTILSGLLDTLGTEEVSEELTQHNGIPVLLGHPGDDNLASLINDSI